ncbi:MAG TPA: hypothetical protein VGC92_02925 [Phenylobacterium sp.]
MRTLILALAAAAALTVAPAAFAQSVSPTYSEMQAPLPQGSGAFVGSDLTDTPADRYDFSVMMLKKKVDRVTREDGGALTPEHASALQKELDTLNRRFGVKVASR